MQSYQQPISNIMECITVDIDLEITKHLNVSFIYWTPDSNIDPSQMQRKICLVIQVRNNFLCGDFNTDISKENSHSLTENVINLMFSMRFYPRIIKQIQTASTLQGRSQLSAAAAFALTTRLTHHHLNSFSIITPPLMIKSA